MGQLEGFQSQLEGSEGQQEGSKGQLEESESQPESWMEGISYSTEFRPLPRPLPKKQKIRP